MVWRAPSRRFRLAKNDGSVREGSDNPDPIASLDSAAPWRRGLVVALFLVLVICLLMPELVFQNTIQSFDFLFFSQLGSII